MAFSICLTRLRASFCRWPDCTTCHVGYTQHQARARSGQTKKGRLSRPPFPFHWNALKAQRLPTLRDDPAPWRRPTRAAPAWHGFRRPVQTRSWLPRTCPDRPVRCQAGSARDRDRSLHSSHLHRVGLCQQDRLGRRVRRLGCRPNGISGPLLRRTCRARRGHVFGLGPLLAAAPWTVAPVKCGRPHGR